MKQALSFLLGLLLIMSCNNNNQATSDTADKKIPGETANAASGDNRITFKVDGNEVKTAGWIVQRFVWDEKTKSPWLNIVSDMHIDKRAININLNGALPGKYIVGQGNLEENSHGSYLPDYSDPMNGFHFKGAEFNITEVDTVKGIVNGTFSGPATNSKGESVNITEGKIINAKLKPGVTNISKGLEDN